ERDNADDSPVGSDLLYPEDPARLVNDVLSPVSKSVHNIRCGGYKACDGQSQRDLEQGRASCQSVAEYETGRSEGPRARARETKNNLEGMREDWDGAEGWELRRRHGIVLSLLSMRHMFH